jgi:hypothetical protein
MDIKITLSFLKKQERRQGHPHPAFSDNSPVLMILPFSGGIAGR